MSWGFGEFSGVPFKIQAYTNSNIYMNYWLRYSMACINMFVWENLPPSCDAQFLEETLFYNGQAAFIDHETIGFMNLKATTGKLDYYNRPSEFICHGSNGTVQVTRDITNAVLIRNNRYRVANAFIVDDYCRRLYEIQATIDINMNAQKTPILILCQNEKDKHTLQQIYKQYEGNKPVIFADKNRMTGDTINVLKTDAPFIIDKLYTYKQQVEHELMTILGIKNNEIIDKKERLNLDEVNANNEIVDIGGDIMFSERELACKKINEMFGLSVYVRYRIAERDNEYYNDEEVEEFKRGEQNEV